MELDIPFFFGSDQQIHVCVRVRESGRLADREPEANGEPDWPLGEARCVFGGAAPSALQRRGEGHDEGPIRLDCTCSNCILSNRK